MPILVEADTTTAGVLATRSRRLAGRRSRGRSGRAAQRSRRLRGRPRAHPRHATAASVADRVRTTHPATSVVLIRHELAPEVFAQAMQVGIGAVVAADDPARSARVSRAKEHLGSDQRPRHDDGDRNGRVFTVFSPKGGVGKTTMAVNLGLALSTPGSEVCVVDLDLAFGDVAITLQLIPDHTIAEAADSEERPGLLDAPDAAHPPREWAVDPGRTRPTPRAATGSPPSLVRRVIQNLRHNFDYIIIDTPPGFDDQVLGAFDETDECVIVATLDVPTIKNTKVAIETLDLLHLVRNNRHLVLNRADEEVGLSLANVEEILGMKVSAPSERDGGRERHQPRSAHRPVQARPPSVQGHQRARPAGRRRARRRHAGEPAKRGLFGRQKKH